MTSDMRLTPFNFPWEFRMKQCFYPRKYEHIKDRMEVINEIECENEEQAQQKVDAFRDLVDTTEFVYSKGKMFYIARLAPNTSARYTMGVADPRGIFGKKGV